MVDILLAVKNRALPSSGERSVSVLKRKRQKRSIIKRKKLQLPRRFDAQIMTRTGNRLMRTKSLILAALRVWELKHRIRE
jgi:hypothetical protein